MNSTFYHPQIAKIIVQVPLFTNSALIGQQLLGIKFSGKKTYYSQYTYGFLIVSVQWLAERWSSVNKLLFGETSLVGYN